eukprot:2723458-Alexandrium_andersonii.AAC.1
MPGASLTEDSGFPPRQISRALRMQLKLMALDLSASESVHSTWVGWLRSDPGMQAHGECKIPCYPRGL